MVRSFELTVPDIGDFADVPVIEVLIEAGQAVTKDATVVTLESDKATMEVPAPESGIVKDVLVKLGDKVSQGTVLARLEAQTANATSAVASAQPPAAPALASAPAAAPAPATSQNGAGNGAAASGSAIELLVPDIGNFDDIPVIEVLIAVGDTIAKDAPLISLESDKATMEVPADAAGTVTAVHVKIGDKVSQGTRVATLAAVGAASAGAPVSPAAPVAAVASKPADPPVAPATVAPPAADSAPAVSHAEAVPSSYGASGSLSATNGAAVHASPSIRRFARELGVRLADVEGTSKNGRITREDVQTFVKAA